TAAKVMRTCRGRAEWGGSSARGLGCNTRACSDDADDRTTLSGLFSPRAHLPPAWLVHSRPARSPAQDRSRWGSAPIHRRPEATGAHGLGGANRRCFGVEPSWIGTTEGGTMGPQVPQAGLEYLGSQKPVTLATASSDGMPHASTFMYVNDGLSIYF